MWKLSRANTANYFCGTTNLMTMPNIEQILVMHQNGETSVVNTAYRIKQGDKIMVLSKVKTRKVEIARGIAKNHPTACNDNGCDC